MVDIKLLVDYIKEGKKKDFTAAQLKSSLIQQGYKLEDIEKATELADGMDFAEISGKNGFKVAQKVRKHNPLVFIGGGVLVLVLIVALIFVNLGKGGKNLFNKTESKFDESGFLKDPFPSKDQINKLPLPTKEDDPFKISTKFLDEQKTNYGEKVTPPPIPAKSEIQDAINQSLTPLKIARNQT